MMRRFMLLFVWSAYLAAIDVVPTLDPGGAVYKTEGPTDPMYAPSTGRLRAAMVFVDFPDAPAGTQREREVAAHLLGDGAAERFVREQSWGRLELEVAIIPGWRRLPRPSSAYVDADGHFPTFALHHAYLTDVCAMLPEYEAARHTILYVVAPRGGALRLSPAFNAMPGTGVKTARGELRLAVTFGNDSHVNRWTNLIHETGHLLGLPDLYRYQPYRLSAGPWDIMCDIFRGTSFMAWHRHKLGWMPSERVAVVRTGGRTIDLVPLSSSTGIAMVVVPYGDASRPRRVLAVEVATPVLGTDGVRFGEGILVSTVDAARPTGEDPVIIHPRRPGNDTVRGDLHLAPHLVGDAVEGGDLPARIRILSRQGEGYRIAVETVR